jgi:RNA polymerase sigma-70 factor (ECF subfamily)
MHDDPASGLDAELLGERRHLLSLGFRMLGTISEAEDAVQETYARWYRMSESERGEVQNVGGWLTRAASRICLDMLGSARARRERYVGPWLPEPVPMAAFGATGAADPLDRVTLDETISTALMVVLELMTPAERLAVVLHDVFAVPFAEIAEIVGRTPASCRQLAASARSRVEHQAARKVPRQEHDRVVRAFAAANRSGDFEALIRALDPNVVLRSDGGGIVTAARNPVYGADRVARFLMGALQKDVGVEVVEQETNDGLGFALWDEGHIVGVVTLEVADSVIANVRMVVNPHKLSLWN